MKPIHNYLVLLLVGFLLAACQPASSGQTITPTVLVLPSPTATRIYLPTQPSLTATTQPSNTPSATPNPPSPTPTFTPTPIFRATPVTNDNGVLLKFTTDQDWVILTIDDGLVKQAALDMLDQLKAAGVKATFFLAGKCARDNLGPDILQRMADEGHEIAYHSMQHPALEDQQKWTLADWEKDYAEWQKTLHTLLSDEQFARAVKPFARAPYGLFNSPFLKLCKEYGLLPVGWSCDPLCVDGTLPLPAGRILIYHIRNDQVDSLTQLLGLDRQIIPLGEAVK